MLFSAVGVEVFECKVRNKKGASPVDAHVGGRIRLRRMIICMSQEQLGEHLNITFQQVQKYEKGINRIGASRLQAIAEVLKVPISFFFEGLPDGLSDCTPGFKDAGVEMLDDTSSLLGFVSSSEGLRLNRAFVLIKDPMVRRRIVDLIMALARHQDFSEASGL